MDICFAGRTSPLSVVYWDRSVEDYEVLVRLLSTICPEIQEVEIVVNNKLAEVSFIRRLFAFIGS